MTTTLALVVLLGSTTILTAQDRYSVSLLVGKAAPKTVSFGDNQTFKDTWEGDPVTSVGLRFGIALPRVATADFQVDATYQPTAKSDLRMTETDPQGRYPDVFTAKYGYSFLGIGARFTWRLPMDLGVGLELRSEKIEFSGNGFPAENASTTRPWLEVHAGYTWSIVKGRPFLRLELAFPLTQEGAPDWRTTSASAIIKATAPKSQFQLAGGIHF